MVITYIVLQSQLLKLEKLLQFNSIAINGEPKKTDIHNRI